MDNLLAVITGGEPWMPHGQCYLWQPGVLWLNVSSDILIAIAYFSLPAALIYFVVKRRDIAFKPLFVMFGVFILACGLTHVMGAVTVWTPAYWISGGIKAITAAASLVTAVMVWMFLPRVLALPSHEQLHEEVLIRTQAEERFRSLLESAPDAIVIVNEKGQMTLVNSQAEKWFGYSREELLDKDVEELVPDRFKQKHVHDRNDYINDPMVRPMGAGLELYGRRKDGSEFPVEISLSPLNTNQGRFITSVIRDISARKEAENSRRVVQERYRELVNNLPLGVFRSSGGLDEKFKEVNPALVEILEEDEVDDLLTKSFKDFCFSDDQFDVLVSALDNDGRVSGQELMLVSGRGRIFYAAITAVVKMDSEQGAYIDGIVEDISVRKEDDRKIRELNESLSMRTQNLESINSELESFSYSVSHDLRAPLRAIDGFSRILLRDYSESLDEKGQDLLERVRNAAQNMSVLIDDLLKLSRMSRVELKCATVDLAELSASTIEALREAEPKRNVDFSIHGRMSAKGDASLLKVVMDNLIGNAWKFTRLREEARIEVGVYKEGENPVYYVRDNGAGFDMSYSEKLFGAFQRLHDAKTYSGTGIGLATVQRIVHKHGGEIWVEAEPDNGAIFYFTLHMDGKHE